MYKNSHKNEQNCRLSEAHLYIERFANTYRAMGRQTACISL